MLYRIKTLDRYFVHSILLNFMSIQNWPIFNIQTNENINNVLR